MENNLENDFKLIIEVLKDIKIALFLDAGTLLGAIRENYFINEDKDIDFGIFRKQLTPEIQEQIIKSLENNGYKFKGFECPAFINRLEPNFVPYVLKFQGKYGTRNIDFHIFEEKETYYYHRGWLGYFHFLKENLDTLDTIEFLGIKILVPHNPEQYLEIHYGKDWRIPKYMSSKDKTPDYPNWSKELK
jgi:phosphorylcholine metabolism protein LicD